MSPEKQPDLKKALILDTDVGTDDACAMLLMAFSGSLVPDYVLTTRGNASFDGACRNALILKKYLGLPSAVVKGVEPETNENVDFEESSTFHGLDGLANIRDRMIDSLKMTVEELSDYITYPELFRRLTSCDEITVITIGPAANLSALMSEPALSGKIRRAYVMGGGLRRFNCSHDTEFNFSKDPLGVKKVLASGIELTLFPLDLTDEHRVTEEQIDSLGQLGTLPEYVTFLRYNRISNQKNRIDGAVLHDMHPVLYCMDPEKYSTRAARIDCDAYGRIFESEAGYPVRIACEAERDIIPNTLREIFLRWHENA